MGGGGEDAGPESGAVPLAVLPEVELAALEEEDDGDDVDGAELPE
ncbi:MAG: hypothetical protein ACP5QO_09150 [Clostridia bacterium]